MRCAVLLSVLFLGRALALRLGAARSLAALVAGAVTSVAPFAYADASLTSYENPRYGTRLSYPSDWVARAGTVSGDRSLQAFVDPNDPDTSASLVFSPIPADYSRISAFGGKDNLREYMAPRGEGVSTEILGETLKGEVYCLEYVVRSPDAPARHVTTVFALRPMDSVVGLTVQTKQETYEANKAKLAPIVPSLEVRFD